MRVMGGSHPISSSQGYLMGGGARGKPGNPRDVRSVKILTIAAFPNPQINTECLQEPAAQKGWAHEKPHWPHLTHRSSKTTPQAQRGEKRDFTNALENHLLTLRRFSVIVLSIG